MSLEHDNLATATALFAAIESGDTARLKQIYAENAVQVEHPNRLKPQGDSRTVELLVRDLARGKQGLREEHYEIEQAIAAGQNVALRVRWRGVLAVPVSTLKPGDEMICESAIFMRFENGGIVEQHNYDCFAPF